MTSWNLFYKRWREGFNYQFKIIRSVLDWTVLLYIVLPAVVISCFIYQSWWSEIPDWMSVITPWTVFLMSYLFSMFGDFRSFLKEADQVFLIKHVNKYIGMKRWAYSYSVLIRALTWMLISFILLPMFKFHFSVSNMHIVFFMLFFLSLNLFIISFKIWIDRIKNKWVHTITYFLLLFLFGSYVNLVHYFWASEYWILLTAFIVISLLISFLIYIPYLNHSRFFWTELIKEQQAHSKYTQLIYGVSPDLEKIKIKKRSKPRLFKHSTPIYKERNALNGWKNLFLKAFLRDSVNWGGYARVVLFITGAITYILPNLILKGVFLLTLVFILSVWLPLLWDHITLAHPIGKASKAANEDDYYLAKKQIINLLTVFGVIVALVGFGISFLVKF